jgi:hypothetical protein
MRREVARATRALRLDCGVASRGYLVVGITRTFSCHLTVRGETLRLLARESAAFDHLRWEALYRAISRGGLDMSPIDTNPIERSVR